MHGKAYVGLEKIKYLFIDGGSLDSVLTTFAQKLFANQEPEINYRELAKEFQKVFYYDCIPAQRKDESDAEYKNRIQSKKELFEQLKALDKFHVYEGTARYRDKRRGQEQKQVDIMIAVDMLSHSFRRNMHEATLLTGDLDFKPLIDALVQDGMYVTLWYPKGRTNYELVEAADSKRPLTIDIVRQWFTKDFNQKIRLPDPSSFDGDIDKDWEEVGIIKTSKHQKITLYKVLEDHVAIIEFLTGQSSLIRHTNLDQLRFYVEHLYGDNFWKQETS
jgi:uncharacterized LabA/DUF88 family protein